MKVDYEKKDVSKITKVKKQNIQGVLYSKRGVWHAVKGLKGNFQLRRGYRMAEELKNALESSRRATRWSSFSKRKKLLAVRKGYKEKIDKKYLVH